MDLLRSSAVRGTEAPSRLGRFLQARYIATLGREASSASIQGRTGVSVSEASYCEYNSAHMLVLSRVADPLRETSRRFLSRPQALIPAHLQLPRLDLIRRNVVTQPGLARSTLRLLALVGFYIPNPHVSIRDRVTSMTTSYLQNPW